MDLGLNGKVALVTGASRGIGNRIALALAAEGMNLSICGRTATTLEAAAEQIRGLGVEVESYVGDITASAGAERFVATAKARFGEQIHVLVNNVSHSSITASLSQPLSISSCNSLSSSGPSSDIVRLFVIVSFP